MFNKKILLYAGLFIASFFVINVGVFFFLKATQPKVGARAAETVAAHATADSLAHEQITHGDSMHVDSARHLGDEHSLTSAAKEVNQAEETNKQEIAEQKVEEKAQVPAATAEAKTDIKEEDQPVEKTENIVAAALTGNANEMAKLAKLLESMKPDEAADIVSHLTTDQIVTLVMKMKDRSAGRMLAALPIEQAARVAERMSQTASRARGG